MPVWPQGRVRLRSVILIESIIDRRGRVCATRLLKGRGPLAESALSALKQWKFEPARQNGRPVPVYFYLAVNICPR
jgi:periplasmic protein TonB